MHRPQNSAAPAQLGHSYDNDDVRCDVTTTHESHVHERQTFDVYIGDLNNCDVLSWVQEERPIERLKVSILRRMMQECFDLNSDARLTLRQRRSCSCYLERLIFNASEVSFCDSQRRCFRDSRQSLVALREIREPGKKFWPSSAAVFWISVIFHRTRNRITIWYTSR